MIQPPDHKTIETIRRAASKMTGAVRRAFQAETARDYCANSARNTEKFFGWSRQAVQKGIDELKSKIPIADQRRSGRPNYSRKLPNLQSDIRSLVDPNSQTHPTFKTKFRYTRMTAKAVIESLVHEKGYKKSELPALSTMRELLGKMNYRLRRVQKTKPQKRNGRDLRQRESRP